MKYAMTLFLLFTNAAFACGVSDAKVTSTHRYRDGHVFVNFDKATNCECSQTKRLAFREDAPNMDYVKSMILLAYATQAPITASAYDESCSVHGNTPLLTDFHLTVK